MEPVFGSLQHKRIPGESLELMDHSPDLGQEFGWAKSNQNIAKVWIREYISFTLHSFFLILIDFLEILQH